MYTMQTTDNSLTTGLVEQIGEHLRAEPRTPAQDNRPS